MRAGRHTDIAARSVLEHARIVEAGRIERSVLLWPRPSMRSVLRDLAKAALVTLAFLALIEGGLELGDMQLAASFTMPDPQRGFRLRPGAHGWHLAEGRNYQRINSL